VPLYDVSGTATGAATVDGSLAVLASASGTATGGSFTSTGFTAADLVASESLVGAANVSGDAVTTIYVSGFVQGAGDVTDASSKEVSGVASGGSVVTANAQRIVGLSGFILGSGSFNMSVPEPIFGVAIVTAHMEVIHVPPPLCEQPVVTLKFRYGHTFTRGDLEFKVMDRRGNPFGPVCITYTLYQMQRGCTLKQVGPSNRKPATAGVGCYYVTGSAGECGQPGLWAVRWRYQRTFGEPAVEKDCYFQVVDSVSCPIPGDTLARHCKYGWD
jgi:hypothetical protein